MGIAKATSQKVIFDYFLTDQFGNEYTLGVTAQVDFGNGKEYSPQGYAIGAETDDEVSVETCAWNDEKGVAGELVRFYDLPEAMQKVIELQAIEEAYEQAIY